MATVPLWQLCQINFGHDGESPMLEKMPDFIDEALRRQRAGLGRIVFYQLSNPFDWSPITVKSSAFGAESALPIQYTADGAGLSPPLEWTRAPEKTQTLVVIVEDADSPTPQPLVHAIVVNLDATDTYIPEAALNSPDHRGVGLEAGRNSYLMRAWLPPDPPPGHGIHRYVFQVFALDGGAEFSAGPGRHELINAIANRAVAAGYLVGTYGRARLAPVESEGQIDMAIAGGATLV
jgi:Raf kinase inhibitor-like YbhB/YbcL family protein